MPIRVIYAEEFYRAAYQLKKRYPHILNDIDTVSDQLEAGEVSGDRVQGLPYRVFKVRVKNTDARRGKSGGYRIIYYLETDEQIIMLTIYSKTDKSDTPIVVIRQIIENYNARKSP